MKLIKKNKKSSSKNTQSKKDFNLLPQQEKNNHNKPLHTGNLIEKKWFPSERK